MATRVRIMLALALLIIGIWFGSYIVSFYKELKEVREKNYQELIQNLKDIRI